MKHNTARCGCGAIVALPSLKASAYKARCESCHRKASAGAASGGLFERLWLRGVELDLVPDCAIARKPDSTINGALIDPSKLEHVYPSRPANQRAVEALLLFVVSLGDWSHHACLTMTRDHLERVCLRRGAVRFRRAYRTGRKARVPSWYRKHLIESVGC